MLGREAAQGEVHLQPLPYGGEVFDELLALGIPEVDIYEAGQKALALCVEVPTEEAVARAEGFTAPQTEPSTP